MRRPLFLLATIAACVGLVACGSKSSTTSSNAPDTGPSGVLDTNSIGAVRVGATEQQARDAFGDPNRTSDTTLVNGFKFHELIWTRPAVRLQFDPDTGKLISYTVLSSELKTADGFHVGTPIADIKQKYGDRLGELLGQPLLSQGEKGTLPGIVFGNQNGVVFRIDGGNVVIND